MARVEFEIIDHGVDHEQYFPGCGVAFTRFEYCVTGAGDSAREAAEDAADQLYQGSTIPAGPARDAFDRALEDAIEELSAEDDAHDGCAAEFESSQPAESWDSWHEGCETQHYVSIRWRVVEGD